MTTIGPVVWYSANDSDYIGLHVINEICGVTEPYKFIG